MTFIVLSQDYTTMDTICLQQDYEMKAILVHEEVIPLPAMLKHGKKSILLNGIQPEMKFSSFVRINWLDQCET